MLFTSHDRKFVESIADYIMVIESHKIKVFDGNYRDYLNRKKLDPNEKMQLKQEILILGNSLTQIIGKLSMPSKDDDIKMLDMQHHEN